jgi:hypothetical protein
MCGARRFSSLPAVQVVMDTPTPRVHLVMVQAEEVETLLPSGVADDPGLAFGRLSGSRGGCAGLESALGY